MTRSDHGDRKVDDSGHAKAPGSFRRSLLWGFWITAAVALVTLVDVVMRQAWTGLAAPAMLAIAMLGLHRSHHHQQALDELPPADGETSFRRRQAARQQHERSELAWGVAALLAWVGAFALPTLLT